MEKFIEVLKQLGKAIKTAWSFLVQVYWKIVNLRYSSFPIANVDNLTVKEKNGKYALFYKKEGSKKEHTDFLYDSVDLMSSVHARLSQKQPDGSILYGVASGIGGLHVTDCIYKSVFWACRDAVKVETKDKEFFAIDNWGHICQLSIYEDKEKKSIYDYYNEEEED